MRGKFVKKISHHAAETGGRASRLSGSAAAAPLNTSERELNFLGNWEQVPLRGGDRLVF